MTTLYNPVLYGQGLFNSSDAVNVRQLRALQGSGFNTVNLFSLHVHGNGDFYYGDTLAVQNGNVLLNPIMASLIAGLRTGGVANVLFSVGSADAGDFRNIQALLATPQGKQILLTNFTALVNTLNIDGFDFDLEEFPLEDFTDTVVELTLMLSSFGKGIITYCPYTDENFWFNCLAQVYSSNNHQQIVRWFNLQCYSGGAGNDPNAWAADLSNFGSPTGVSNPSAFMVPGYSVNQNPGTPAQIQQTLSGFQKLNGCFIWNSGNIFKSRFTPKQYAQAIIAGLEAETSVIAAAS